MCASESDFRGNESIVCLPNRVVVTVTNSKKKGWMDLHSKQLWRKTAFMGVFLALAMICSYIEMLIPFDFGIPGVKLGLTNIVVVLMLYSIGTKEAFCVSVIRIFIVGILFGNLIGILYSLGGGILSFLVMALLKKETTWAVFPSVWPEELLITSGRSL